MHEFTAPVRANPLVVVTAWRRFNSAVYNLLCGITLIMETSPLTIGATIALLEPVAEKNLPRGSVGTIVDELPDAVFLIEFSDAQGCTTALVPVTRELLLPLHYPQEQVV